MHELSTTDLPHSRLYTFIDGPREYALYFLEGQRLIRDLALIHGVTGAGFAYFRDVVLSVQPTIALLKQGEQLGFYIDSETRPFFRLKIETGHHGVTRCTLRPENFLQFPETMRGLVRVQKLFPRNQPPYQSVLEIDGLPLPRDRQPGPEDLVPGQLRDDDLPHERPELAFCTSLPPLPQQENYDYSPEAVRSRREGERAAIESIFEEALHGPRADRAGVRQDRLPAAGEPSRAVPLAPARGERMVQNVRKVYLTEGESLFDPGESRLQITCEYCKSDYIILRDDLTGSGRPAALVVFGCLDRCVGAPRSHDLGVDLELPLGVVEPSELAVGHAEVVARFRMAAVELEHLLHHPAREAT